MHVDLNAIVNGAIPVVALVVPYLIKNHSRVKAILSAIEQIAHAANGPEQS